MYTVKRDKTPPIVQIYGVTLADGWVTPVKTTDGKTIPKAFISKPPQFKEIKEPYAISEPIPPKKGQKVLLHLINGTLDEPIAYLVNLDKK